MSLVAATALLALVGCSQTQFESFTLTNPTSGPAAQTNEATAASLAIEPTVLPTTSATPQPTVASAAGPAVTAKPREPWGVVLDQGGLPLSHAEVFIEVFDDDTGGWWRPSGPMLSEETRGFRYANEAGEFSWGVLPGTYRVGVSSVSGL